MTTSKTEEDVDRTAEWHVKCTDQLFEIADKDEWKEEYSWPSLKDEIKYLLKETFEKWPSSSSPILHPAAALIPLNSSNIDDVSTSSSSLSSSNLAVSANGHGTSNGNHPSSNIQRSFAQQGLNNRFTMQGSGGMGGGNGLGTNDDGEGNGLDQDISIKESDMQAFFPSKRQAPAEWRGSWGKRIDTYDELQKEQRIIHDMLDDFENQPPFTIQRLAELVLHPTQHHHTLPKYVSALKRVLAVTATRDAFPARVEEEEEDLLAADGLSTGGGNEVEMINGTFTGAASVSSGGNRSRRTTPGIPNSPTSTPLFSPIPFLMKSGDEGMPGTGPMINESDMSEEGVEASMLDRDVPSMELAGADRTTEEAADKARRSGKGSGTNKSVIDGATQQEGDDLSGSSIETEGNVDGVVNEKKIEGDLSSDSTHSQDLHKTTNGAINSIVQKVEPNPVPSTTSSASGSSKGSAELGHAGELVPQNSLGTTTTTASEPLGVPAGPVDEVDQIGDKHGQLRPLEPGSVAGGARAFSSTTATVTSQPNEEEQTGFEDDQNSEGRALKRVRSDRHLNNDSSSTNSTSNNEVN